LEAKLTIHELQRQIALLEDMKAYEKLYALLFTGLHRFSYSMVKSSEVAEEIVSDVFIKIWQIRHRLMEIDNLKIYCYTITKNFSLNYITRHYKSPAVGLDELDVRQAIAVPTPEDLYISSEKVKEIQQAISQLPPQCKLIFQLVKEDGLQYKEVASILDISPLTVRNQLAIAIKTIAAIFPPDLRPKAVFLGKFSQS
jgi:RNA polymerase sigma-70 factor (family 1)